MAFDFPPDLVQLQRDFLAAVEAWRQAARDGDEQALNTAYLDFSAARYGAAPSRVDASVDRRHAAGMALRAAALAG